MKTRGPGWEGNPISSYRWALLALAFVPGLLLGIFMSLYRLTLRIRPVDLSSIPKDAIVYGYHVDLFPNFMHLGYFRQYPGRGFMLGSHIFLSYLMNVGIWFLVPGMRIHRYDPRDRGGNARSWVIESLMANPGLRMALFTDSGGPYERVRASLPRLAQATGRPCVALRVRAGRAIRIRHHFFPLPGSEIEVRYSAAIPAAEAMHERLTREIEGLRCRRLTPERRRAARGQDRRVRAG